MEARIQQLEHTVNALLTQFLPPVTQRLAAAEARAEAAEARIAALESRGVTAPASAASEKKRTPTDAPTYHVIKGLADQGMTEKQIEAQTGVAYTTVRSYLRWTPEQVVKSNQQWQERVAKAAAAGKPAPTPQYMLNNPAQQAPQQACVAPQAVAPTVAPQQPVTAPQQPPVPPVTEPYAVTHGPTVAPASQPVGGVVIGQMAPPQSDVELAYLAAQAASQAGAYVPPVQGSETIVDVEFTEVPAAPAPQQADGDHGEAGWFNWTNEQKTLAEQFKDPATGLPLYPPCPVGTVVKVQYMNETYSPRVLMQNVDWTSSGGVLRWRVSTDQTSDVAF